MRKFEAIYRELLLRSIKGDDRVAQKELAGQCQLSIGLVNKIVKKLSVASAVESTRRGVRIISPGRIINLWATERLVWRDVWKAFRLDDLHEAERSLPPATLLSGFGGWVVLSGRKPAEYDRLFFYVTDRERFESWLSFRQGRVRSTNPNIFALKEPDRHLHESSLKGVVCVPQLYVDIYSVNGPEAQPFLRDIVEVYPMLNPL